MLSIGASPPPRRRPLRQRLVGLAFCAPLLAVVVALVVWPLISLVRYSFTTYGGLAPPEWVGLKNYRFLLKWQDFRRIVLNNILILLGLVIWVTVPFVLAIILFGRRSANLVRTVLFVPAMLSPIIVGNVFRIILADDGPANTALETVGLGRFAPGWLSDPTFVLVTLALVICWATMGSGILFYTSGLTAISPSYVEAALIDGANWRQIVWHVYRPALRPITRFWMLLLTVTTITGFFPWVYGLTQGGPGVSSTTLDYAVYQTLNQGNQLGRGAAIAVVSVLLVLLVVTGQQMMRLLRGIGRLDVTSGVGNRGPSGMVQNAVIVVAVLTVLGPLLWVIRVATRPPEDYLGDPGGWGVATTLRNFVDAWNVADLGAALWTSASIVLPGALIATSLAALAGWGYAKFEFPGRGIAMGVTSAAMFLPIAALAMPLFEIGMTYHAVGHRWFLSLVYGAIFAPWTSLFLCSYYQGLPGEITEAAALDGASSMRTFLSIAVPLSLPAIATVFVLNAFLQWSELLLALLLLPSGDDTTVSVAIAQFSTQFRTGGPLTAAALLIGSLPILLLFLLGQRWIRAGMLTGGVKD